MQRNVILHHPNPTVVVSILIGFTSLLEVPLPAQTFKTLHHFSRATDTNISGLPINADGANPYAGLVLSNGVLYGTTTAGGSSGLGAVFGINIDGTGFTNLHSFGPNDGNNPYGGLVLSGTALYGTTIAGGDYGGGSVFVLHTDGTGFKTLYNFLGGSDGLGPYAGLVLVGNMLYGTAVGGGSLGSGTVYALNTNGTGFTNAYNFRGSDGGFPYAGLSLSNGVLYGTTVGGGFSGSGTIYYLNSDGTGFMGIYGFSSGDDGSAPYAGFIVSGQVLYGTASSNGKGTMFAVNTDGSQFTPLHGFNGGSDGGNPRAGLVLSGDTLYGTAAGGGISTNGTVFAVSTNGTGFVVLHSFTGSPNEGAGSLAGLVLSGNTLYGTTAGGGSAGNGTVFSITLSSSQQPQLTITPSGANVILAWPTNAGGFTLQTATNVVSSGWTPVSSLPVVVNGQNTVTNSVSGAQQYFRLSQ